MPGGAGRPAPPTAASRLGACLAEGVRRRDASRRKRRGSAGDAGAPPPARRRRDPGLAAPLWLVPVAREAPGRGAKPFVDFQNDVTAADVVLAAREGYRSVEHSSATPPGHGHRPGQDQQHQRAGDPGARRWAAPIPDVGTTTFRPPYTPVTFGALRRPRRGRALRSRSAGRRSMPGTRSAAPPSRMSASGSGPGTYPQPGENHARRGQPRGHGGAQRRRHGRRLDARQDRHPGTGRGRAPRTGLHQRLGQARRRPLPLRPDARRGRHGLRRRRHHAPRRAPLPDDHHHRRRGARAGLARGLAADRVAGAARSTCTSVTEQWATVAIGRPAQPRGLARRCADDIDSRQTRSPSCRAAKGRVAGIPARVFRISFSGELSYEINVAPSYGARALGGADGRRRGDIGITPYGTETMHVLRAEKGYIIVGQETDGTVTPGRSRHGLDRRQEEADFIGKRSLARSDTARGDRKQLVGLLTDDPAEVLPEGGQIVADASARQAAGADDRPRDLELLQRLPRPLDRAGAGEERSRAHGRDGVDSARRRSRAARASSRAPCSSTPKEHGRMSERLREESPLGALRPRCPLDEAARQRRRRRPRASVSRAPQSARRSPRFALRRGGDAASSASRRRSSPTP